MLRVLFIGVVLSSFSSEEDLIKYVTTNNNPDNLSLENAVDPVITGETISDEHKRLWKIQNEKYLECGLCGQEPQPFPGD